MIRLSVIIAMVLHAFLVMKGQNIGMRHYDVSNGLPSSECYWIMQDSRHFLWIATDAGVVRYDGYQFVTYTNAKGLPDNTVFKIHEGRDGKLWFCSYSGKMSYYDRLTDSIYGISANAELTRLSRNMPDDFYLDPKDTLWISYRDDGYVKVIPPLYRSYMEYNSTERGYHFKEIYPDGVLCGYTTNTKAFINEWLPVYNLSARYQPPLILGQMKDSKGPFTIQKLPDGSYLYSNAISLYQIKGKEMSLVRNAENKDGICSMLYDSQGRLWLSTVTDGVYLYETPFSENPSRHLLAGNFVTCSFEDKDKGYWFSTINKGVFYVPSLDFNYWTSADGLSSDIVKSIRCADDKLYCITGDKKLNTIDLRNGAISQDTAHAYEFILAFGHRLYLGLRDPLILDTRTSAVTKIRSSNPLEECHAPWAIASASGSLLSFDRAARVFRVDPVTGIATRLCWLPYKIFCIYEAPDGIYMGTKQGLFLLRKGVLHNIGEQVPELNGRIEAMTGSGDTLFIATRSDGLLLWSRGKVVGRFTEKSGLAGNICKCITRDAARNIWVGTNKGISRLVKESNGTFRCENLQLTNGLMCAEINHMLEYKQQLYFVTNNGIGHFDIRRAFEKKAPAPLYIESFYSNSNKLDPARWHTLRYNENFIRINYKSISLRHEGNILYKYRLEGLDTSWTYTHNTFVQYTTLPDGDYKFEVYALEAGKHVIGTPTFIRFQILKPFWKEWWFLFLVCSLILLCGYLFYTRRIRIISEREKQKAELHIQIANSELKALRAQMNPHFIFNSLNAIQGFIIKDEPDLAQKYLVDFSRLIRLVLENTKHETVLLQREVECLRLYLELQALRSSFNYEYEISIPEALYQRTIYIPAMLIQPYVENAILHGVLPLTERKGKISLLFSESDSVLTCVIDDNGIGRQKAMETRQANASSHQSIGMVVTGERIDTLNKYTPINASVEITDKYENHQAMGTTVTLRIKI